MSGNTRKKLAVMDAAESRNIGRIRAFVDAGTANASGVDRREWMLAHARQRMEELQRKGYEWKRPDILERYELEILGLEAKLHG